MSKIMYVNDLKKKYGSELVIHYTPMFDGERSYRKYYVEYKGKMLISGARVNLKYIAGVLSKVSSENEVRVSQLEDINDELVYTQVNAQQAYINHFDEPAPSGIEVDKVFFNEKKRTTTVLFKDGDRVIVKSAQKLSSIHTLGSQLQLLSEYLRPIQPSSVL